MKVLPQGTLRFLLIDTAEVQRNHQRRAARGPVAIVSEANPDKPGASTYHDGYGLLADGPLALVYDATTKVAVLPDKYKGLRVDQFAAYATYGRVALAESPEEAESLRLEAPVEDDTATSAPPLPENKPPARPSTKQPQVKKPEEGNK